MAESKKERKSTDPRIILACAQDAVIAFEHRDAELKKIRYNEKDADKLTEAKKQTFRNTRNLVRAKKRVETLMGGGTPSATLNVEDYI